VAERPHPPPAPRARPVAELSIEELLSASDELARGWAIALILVRPAGAIGEVPVEDLAREAPALCAQVLRAVRSDAELERLTGRGGPGGCEDRGVARSLTDVCGARDPATLVDATEALRGVLWEALSGQLRWAVPERSRARLPAELGDRLAYVCSAMLAAAIEAAPAGAGAPAGKGREGREERDGRDGREEREEPGSLAGARGAAAARDSRAVIVDERASGPAGERASERPSRLVDSAHAPSVSVPSPRSPSPAEIEIHDQRGAVFHSPRREEGPAAWTRSIGARLERFERDGVPFAVLLVELLDLERLRRPELAEELARTAARMEDALGGALDAGGSLTRERPGRWWLLAPSTDRADADRLAGRLAAAAAHGLSARRPSPAVAVGTAVCPEDGRQAAALAAHADLGLYAARAAARAGSSAG
jgi:GGDEF domain-containing protein